jgi:hypothetical protein
MRFGHTPLDVTTLVQLDEGVSVDYHVFADDRLVEFRFEGGPTFELSVTEAGLARFTEVLGRAAAELREQAAAEGPA